VTITLTDAQAQKLQSIGVDRIKPAVQLIDRWRERAHRLRKRGLPRPAGWIEECADELAISLYVHDHSTG
jgi:hypothetical protein